MCSEKKYLFVLIEMLEESLKKSYSDTELTVRETLVKVFCRMEIKTEDFAAVERRLEELSAREGAGTFAGRMQSYVDSSKESRRVQIMALGSSHYHPQEADDFPTS